MIGKFGYFAGRTASVATEYLVVGGGGAGGEPSGVSTAGGGGGAGGLLTGSVALARGAVVAVTVGAGGQVGGELAGGDGGNSVFGDIESTGGGGGGDSGQDGRSGGSGGGGGRAGSGTTSGGAGTSEQGEDGADGTTANAGNGGGSGGTGTGTSSSIAGAAATYAAGGTVGDGATPTANTGTGGNGGTTGETTGIVVSGAGTAAVNGTYFPDGTYGSPASTKYRLSTTEYHIVVDSLTWAIVSLTGETITTVWYYLNSLTMDENGIAIPNTPPPAGPGWESSGATPVPGIFTEFPTTTPQSGASGVVVIAFPDTLPPAVVGAGLTFTEPTRSGHRVYRFTGGTGTVTMP